MSKKRQDKQRINSKTEEPSQDFRWQVAAGIVPRVKYRLEGNQILPDHSQNWRDWPKKLTYDPFERYYQGEKPHQAFINLIDDPKPEKVLVFINEWGLPKSTMKIIDQVIEEARRMYFYARIIDTLKDIPLELDWADPSAIHQLRALVTEMRRKGLRFDLRADELPRAVDDLIRSVPGGVITGAERQKMQASFAQQTQELLNVTQDPTTLPDERLIGYLRGVINHEFYHCLKVASPMLFFHEKREGNLTRLIPTVSYATPDLLTALYIMLAVDLAKDGLRKCLNINCSRYFIPTRKDQLYCPPIKGRQSSCAHAMAMRMYRERQKNQEKVKRDSTPNSRKRRKRHGRIQKRK